MSKIASSCELKNRQNPLPDSFKPSRQLADNRQVVNCLSVRTLQQKTRWSDSFGRFLVILNIILQNHQQSLDMPLRQVSNDQSVLIYCSVYKPLTLYISFTLYIHPFTLYIPLFTLYIYPPHIIYNIYVPVFLNIDIKNMFSVNLPFQSDNRFVGKCRLQPCDSFHSMKMHLLS